MKRKRGRIYVGDQYFETHSGLLWTVTEVGVKIRLYATDADQRYYPGTWLLRQELHRLINKEILIEVEDPL